MVTGGYVTPGMKMLIDAAGMGTIYITDTRLAKAISDAVDQVRNITIGTAFPQFREDFAKSLGEISDRLSEWDTELFARKNKSRNNRRINQMQGKLRHARGRKRNRLELEMFQLREQVKLAS